TAALAQPCASALLALGTMAGNLADADAARADELIGFLLQALAAAREEDARRIAALALGNAGSPRALPALRPLLAAESAALRSAAVYARRSIEGDEPEEHLVAALRRDADAAVRLRAVQALSSRPATPRAIAAAAEALAGDAAPEVRRALIEPLA